MNYSILGEQIQKLRKEAKLTQRELGESIGVSASAVSQWESGGTPDVTLLPAIADRLGVTIDTLFGRESGAGLNMTKTLATWLKTRPADTRLQDMSRLLWEASGMGILNIPSLKDYPESYEGTDDEGNKVAVYTAVSKESGCVLGIAGMDLSFMSVFPEPKEGYESYLLSDEAYQEFFTLLGRPGCIRLLRWFCKQKINYYIPSIAAEQIGLSVEECEALMKAMGEASLLFQIELTLPEGTVNAYKLDNDGSIIPFLYFARWVNENERTRWYSYSTNTRKRPWLAASEDREKKKEK